MPVKRSRIGTASSLGETDLINYVSSPIGSPWECVPAPQPSLAMKPPKFQKPSLEEQSSGFQQAPLPSVLRLASPDTREIDRCDRDRIGGFLELCYFCRDKICPNKEVYMYSDLRAFCSAACRDRQITLDMRKEKLIAKRKAVDQEEKVHNLKFNF